MRNIVVQPVTAYIELPVIHLSKERYMEYGRELALGCAGAHQHVRLEIFGGALTDCWLYKWLVEHYGSPFALPPATATPPDRYPTPEVHIMSHIIQHNRTEWALKTTNFVYPDVMVWFDFALTKQGGWNGRPITCDHVIQFLDNVAKYYRTHDDIPFPGITDTRGQVDPHGNNWRFCGSTHIWPREHLQAIDRYYKHALIQFIKQHRCIPLDLAIWPIVEAESGLPFRWYQAEYDHTQLTEFPHDAAV